MHGPQHPSILSSSRVKKHDILQKRDSLQNLELSTSSKKQRVLLSSSSHHSTDKIRQVTPAAPKIGPTSTFTQREPFSLSSLSLKRTFESALGDCKNIDEANLQDPKFCSIYAVRYYDRSNYKEHINQIGDYIKRSGYIIFTDYQRSMVVENIQSLSWKCCLAQGTVHLAVNIMDRYCDLATQSCSSRKSLACEFIGIGYMDNRISAPETLTVGKLLRIALASIVIAQKLEENGSSNPRSFLDRLLDVSQGCQCTKKELICMELKILSTLRWDVIVPTSHTFLLRYVRAGELSDAELRVAGCFIDRCLLEYSLQLCAPSKLAATCVSMVRQCFGKLSWSRTLQRYTVYCEEDLQSCLSAVQRILYDEQCSRKLLSENCITNKGESSSLDVTPTIRPGLLRNIDHCSNTVKKHHSASIYSVLVSEN